MRTSYAAKMERGQPDLRAMLHHGFSGAGHLRWRGIYGVPLGDGNYHCFNKVGDAVFDLTSEQFDHPLAYSMDFLQSRETHFAKAEKKARFETLKDALKRKAKS